MTFTAILILGLCFCSITSYKLFKGDAIPKNYAIGIIKYLEYIGNDKIYFTTQEDVLGLMNATSGALSVIYELEDDQKILQNRGSRFVVVQKDRDINLFLPRDQTYFKLQYSTFLKKQTFKEIISFKRFGKHDYILTEQFLAKAQNPYAMSGPFNRTQGEKFQIIQKRTDPHDTYFKLISVADKQPAIGLVLFNENNNQKSICILKFLIFGSDQPLKVCGAIDPKMKIINVMEMGKDIQVTTDQKNIFYNNNLEVIEQIKNKEMIAFFEQLNKATDPNYKQRTGQKRSDVRKVRNFANPSHHVTLNIYQRYISVRKDDTVLANIEKNSQDIPIQHWIYTKDPRSSKFNLIIQYQDGKVFCYEIDEKTKNYETLWTFNINPADKKAKGQERQAKQVSLQTQEDLLQKFAKDQENDIQINNNQNNKP